MKWRLLLEIELPPSASADDALEWFTAALSRAVNFVEFAKHPYKPRIVSATPVTKGK